MKIAIPTENGLTVNQNFAPVKGFLVSTFQLGQIVEQEMRWNSPSTTMTIEDEVYKNLDDCEKVIVRNIDNKQSQYLQMHNKEVIKTEETIITKVLLNYLQNVLQKESNTCCCP